MMNINAKSGGIPRRSKLFIHPRLGFATSIKSSGEPKSGRQNGPSLKCANSLAVEAFPWWWYTSYLLKALDRNPINLTDSQP